MKHYRQIEMRTRRNYNPDCMHLDPMITLDWQYRVLSTKETPTDDGYTVRIRIKVTDKSLTANQVHNGLYDEFIKGCSCEYDCCGHMQGGIFGVEKPHNHKKGEWILFVSYWPNY